jgi:hypothetical protein
VEFNPHDYALCFLTYVSRSGSTLLSSLLDRHPDVLVTIEADFPPSLLGLGANAVRLQDIDELRRYLRHLLDDDKFRRWGVDVGRLEAAAVAAGGPPFDASGLLLPTLALYAADHGLARGVVVFKGRLPTPRHFHGVRARYPGSRMLHVVRDPRAVWLSQKGARNQRNGMPLGWSPQRSAADWAQQAGQALQLRDAAGFRLVRYEDLVRDAEATAAAVCGWLDLDAAGLTDGDESGYRDRIPPEQRHLHELVGRAADTARIDRWREQLPDAEILAVEQVAGPLMARFGYPSLHEGAAGEPARALRRLDASRVLEYRLKRLLRLGTRPGLLRREFEARRKGW